MVTLSERQLKTLTNLQKKGFNTPEQVISWAYTKLRQHGTHKHQPRAGRRKHSLKYYQEIIDFMEKG